MQRNCSVDEEDKAKENNRSLLLLENFDGKCREKPPIQNIEPLLHRKK